MVSVEIDLTTVHDSEDFHDAFARALGFPDFYGRNMNAWEDMLSDLSKPGVVGMTTVEVPAGEDLVLRLNGAAAFADEHPDLFGALVGSTAHVNRLKVTLEGSTRILLLLT